MYLSARNSTSLINECVVSCSGLSYVRTARPLSVRGSLARTQSCKEVANGISSADKNALVGSVRTNPEVEAGHY